MDSLLGPLCNCLDARLHACSRLSQRLTARELKARGSNPGSLAQLGRNWIITYNSGWAKGRVCKGRGWTLSSPATVIPKTTTMVIPNLHLEMCLQMIYHCNKSKLYPLLNPTLCPALITYTGKVNFQCQCGCNANLTSKVIAANGVISGYNEVLV